MQFRWVDRLAIEATRPEPTVVVTRGGVVMATLFGPIGWQDLLPLIEIALGPGTHPRAA